MTLSLPRRGFLTGMLAACAAPAVIRTPGLLMPIKPRLVAAPIGFVSVGDVITVSGQGARGTYVITWVNEISEFGGDGWRITL